MSSLFQFQNWVIAYHLAYFDVKMRYVRSVLGPFWITIQTAIFILTLSAIFTFVYKSTFDRYLPFFAISFVMWGMFSSSMIESANAIVRSQGYIKERGIAPIIFVQATFLKNFIYLLHNLPIAFIVLIYFKFTTPLWFLFSLPGFILYCFVIYLMSILVSFIASRFHDTGPLIESLTNLLFFMSPIIWEPSTVAKHPEILNFNPMYHMLEIWRGPLLNGEFSLMSYIVVGGIVLCLLAALTIIMPNYKKVSLWV